MVAAGAVVCALTIGTTLGLIAGYMSKLTSQIIMRLSDVIMSFPSLLLAVIVLYMLPPSVGNIHRLTIVCTRCRPRSEIW